MDLVGNRLLVQTSLVGGEIFDQQGTICGLIVSVVIDNTDENGTAYGLAVLKVSAIEEASNLSLSLPDSDQRIDIQLFKIEIAIRLENVNRDTLLRPQRGTDDLANGFE